MFTTAQRRKAQEHYDEIRLTVRPITTAYIEEGRIVKRITANSPNAAMMRCFMHMTMNHYGASVAQIYSTETARLYAEIVRHKDNRVEITMKTNPTTFDDPLRRDPTRAYSVFL